MLLKLSGALAEIIPKNHVLEVTTFLEKIRSYYVYGAPNLAPVWWKGMTRSEKFILEMALYQGFYRIYVEK